MRIVTASLLGLWTIASGAAPLSAQVLDVNTIVTTIATEQTGPFVRALKSTGSLIYHQDDPLPAGLDFPALSLNVAFSDPGHLLSTEGMKALRSVGLALADPRLGEDILQVAGHVHLSRNQAQAARLAQRRAEIVAAHLVTFYGIDPDRVVPIGYGPTRPLDPAAPGQAADTRIEFINVTDLAPAPER